MIECKECACLPVCKEVDNYKEYKKQYLVLRDKSSLFDEDPKCPYYINKLQIIHNKEIDEECTCCNPKDNRNEEEREYIKLNFTRHEDLIDILMKTGAITGIRLTSK